MSPIIDIPKKLPLLSLAEEVLLPGCQIRIAVTPANVRNFKLVRSRLLSDVEPSVADGPDHSWSRGPIIGLIPRKYTKEADTGRESPSVAPLGTAAVVDQVMAVGWPQPTFTLVLTGLSRIRVEKLLMEVPYPVGVVTVPEKPGRYLGSPELEEAANSFRSVVLKLLSLATDTMNYYFLNIKRMITSLSATELPDMCTSFFGISYAEKLELLAAFDLMERYKVANGILMRLMNAVYKSATEQGQQKNRATILVRIMPKDGQLVNFRHKPPILSQRMGGATDSLLDHEEDSIQELYKKLKAAQMPPDAWKVALKEFQRLKRLTPNSPELPILRSYLELMSDMPWSTSSAEVLDIRKAKQDLDTDHYAMEKLKKRVLEYLAVRQLKNSLRGPILCFVGPPGVGKTSIGRSIAHTLNRKFHRISLGGTCNQSDIRGHRRTYIGAMPGRIIQGLKTVGVNNPVMLLDEVDKLQVGMNGDPGAALLEVLDPEQNHTFHDHYLNVPFDLSQVMFIATANSVKTIPRALLDRMEVIPVDGYTHEEKFHIAMRHLILKQVAQHGLDQNMIQIPGETVKLLIKEYTREAGVRSLERKLGALCRDVAVKVASRSSNDAAESVIVDCEMLDTILGPAPFSDTQLWSRLGQPGIAVGLSVTEVGGEVLLVEANKMDGDGELQLTGQLGSVMKESANLALSYLRTYAYKYGLHLDSEMLSRTDIHVHFPEGAIAKEGPSAGVALVIVLVSLFSDRPVATDIAFTGEISLKGTVLPVGGVKAKVLAAHRAGIRRVILPDKNAKDLQEIPQEVKDEMTFVFVSHVDEAIQAAFNGGFPMTISAEQIQPIISKL